MKTLPLIFFRERLEAVEKDARLASLQRSPGGHSHSHDSAIDSDLQEWETENIDLDMVSKTPVLFERQSLTSSKCTFCMAVERSWVHRGLGPGPEWWPRRRPLPLGREAHLHLRHRQRELLGWKAQVSEDFGGDETLTLYLGSSFPLQQGERLHFARERHGLQGHRAPNGHQHAEERQLLRQPRRQEEKVGDSKSCLAALF